MGDWSLQGGNQRFKSVAYTSIPSAAGANTKGAWTEFVTSLDFDISGIYLFPWSGTYAADFLFDIGIGAGGSEVVAVENLLFTWFNTSMLRIPAHIFIPIRIPAGTRVALRTQSTYVGVNSLTLSAIFFGGPFVCPQPFSVATTFGANTADSGGTSVDPGASAGVKGSYVEFSAATPRDARALLLMTGAQRNHIRSNARWLMDISVGAAASEEIVIPDIQIGANGTINYILPAALPLFPVSIPAGSRLVVRASCDINDASDRLFDLVICGFA